MSKSIFLIAGLSVAMMVIQACSDDANANTGLSEAQVKALIADAVEPLEAKITALENAAGMKPNTLAASSGSTASGMQKASAVTDICTVLDYTPSAAFPGKMNSASCKSPNGYLLTMPITSGADTVRPLMLDDSRIYFESVDCTGPAYIHPDQLGDMGLTQGAVFDIPSNATMYVPADAPIVENLNTGSVFEFDGGAEPVCNPQNPGLTGVLILDNDPSVTGIQNTYTGPISMF